MIRTDMGDITDEEFEKVVVPFDRKVDEYIKNNILNEFIACPPVPRIMRIL